MYIGFVHCLLPYLTLIQRHLFVLPFPPSHIIYSFWPSPSLPLIYIGHLWILAFPPSHIHRTFFHSRHPSTHIGHFSFSTSLSHIHKDVCSFPLFCHIYIYRTCILYLFPSTLVNKKFIHSLLLSLTKIQEIIHLLLPYLTKIQDAHFCIL
jgi:hypothetical protein